FRYSALCIQRVPRIFSTQPASSDSILANLPMKTNDSTPSEKQLEKSSLRCFLTILAGLPFAALVLAPRRLRAQGTLTPPGAPASTKKPLHQLQPRTPVYATHTPGDTDILFKITQPGSYYLTGNVTGVNAKHCVEIASSGVTLDLNGFDLVGVPGSLD